MSATSDRGVLFVTLPNGLMSRSAVRLHNVCMERNTVHSTVYDPSPLAAVAMDSVYCVPRDHWIAIGVISFDSELYVVECVCLVAQLKSNWAWGRGGGLITGVVTLFS